ETVLRAGKSGAKTAIGRLEHVGDSGEPPTGKKCRIKPALRRAPGMHALDHGAILRRHQPAGLGAGDAERMHSLFHVECQRARGGGCRGKYAYTGPAVTDLAYMLRAHAQADARSHSISRQRRGDEILSGKLRMRFRYRDERRQCHGADMQDSLTVHVVEFKTLHLRAVDQ